MCGSVVVKNVIAMMVIQACTSQSVLKAPPKFEEKPLLLDSYIPATMQILAYLTEQMKYNLRPTTTAPPLGPTAAPTMRPTPPHRPAVYAPDAPPGAHAYYDSIKKEFTYKDYIERLSQNTGDLNYFDRYKFFLNEESDQSRESRNSQMKTNWNEDGLGLTEDMATYYGKNYIAFWKQVKQVVPDYIPNDIDAQTQDFLKHYDDSDFRLVLLRQKQIPPTRAYVTLLSLYDQLNKESKRLGLNKYQTFLYQKDFTNGSNTSEFGGDCIKEQYQLMSILCLLILQHVKVFQELSRDGMMKLWNTQYGKVILGYTERILKELVEGSKSTSSYQLRMVLNKVIDRDDTKTPTIVKKIKNLIADIDDPNSYINLALRYIVPLSFAL